MILVSGASWFGSGLRSISSVLEEMVMNAKSEILIGVYSIGSIDDALFFYLTDSLNHGVNLVMFINRYRRQPEWARDYFERLRAGHSRVIVYSVECPEGEDFHAKVFVVDRSKAIIGSANLSQKGFTYNYEMGVYVEGILADEAASALERLIINGVARKI